MIALSVTSLLLAVSFITALSEAKFRPSYRGEFAVNQGNVSPNLFEGDIAVTERRSLTGSAQNAFIKDTTRTWNKGWVPYRYETDVFDVAGVEEPVFADKQIKVIGEAMQKITDDVPCIHFR